MASLRLTAAQAAVRWLTNQYVTVDGHDVRYFAGVWAIFGHGNVAGIGEALYSARDVLPTWRGQNEQGMAHAAIAYAKQMRRRRAMVCTSSIGPGATNMVTAAALAHVDRLPVLLLPGDVFASRRPDPVLQQVEDFVDGTVSANDCFRPVSRYFNRITRPEQIIEALPHALTMMLNPAQCGPATIAFCQDVQAEAFDFPEDFFTRRFWQIPRPEANTADVTMLADALRTARQPLLIVGGGVLYSGAEAALAKLAEATGLAVTETQAGKGALPWDHACNLGAIGVTGSSAANAAAARADLVVGIGTRMADFTTGSGSLFAAAHKIQVNVQAFDACKHGALPVIGDARNVLQALTTALSGWRAPVRAERQSELDAWTTAVDAATAGSATQTLPSDAQVIGAVQRGVDEDAIVVCAAGGLPGELHKLWRTSHVGGYHVEYGYSCMGYEIAGAIGVKMAAPEREVVVMVGDGSYLMLNSELVSSVMLGLKLIVIVLDNRGFGCINRLQHATGGAGFNNLLADATHDVLPKIDFAAHAASLGALSEHVGTLGDLASALARAQAAPRTYVVVIDTDPLPATDAGGCWWDVVVPEVSTREQVLAARHAYEQNVQLKRDLS